jgi:secreted trypsin-like serine protease
VVFKIILLVFISAVTFDFASAMDCSIKPDENTYQGCPEVDGPSGPISTDCRSTLNQQCPVGGSETAVGIVYNGEIVCTGVLISSNTVLTAAHCFNEPSNGPLSSYVSVKNIDPTKYAIYWGNGNLGGMVNKEETSEVVSAHRFPNYPTGLDYEPNNSCNECDIAMIILKKSHPEKQIAKLATLADYEHLNSSTVLEQVGYGSMDTYQSRNDSLKGIKHYIYSNFYEISKEGSSKKFDEEFAQLIFTKNNSNQDTGSGDSGGPLLLRNNNMTTIYGVLGGSANGHLTRYTMTLPFTKWILSFNKK